MYQGMIDELTEEAGLFVSAVLAVTDSIANLRLREATAHVTHHLVGSTSCQDPQPTDEHRNQNTAGKN